jgi:cytochrome c-type biogenesis protein CcmH
MAFWIAAIVLTAAACLAVLWPLGRRPAQTAPDAAAHDVSVYKDQLGEIERDLERGAIGTSDAEQARTEIARRIVKLDRDARKTQVRSSGTISKALATIAVLSIPLVSWGLYGFLGSPDLPSQPLSARLNKDPATSTPEELVARAEAYLTQNPNDGRGWDVLAPSYIQMNRYQEAIAAYRNAIRLVGESAARRAGLGEALTMANGGVVTDEAQSEFDAALALQPDNARAMFFSGLAMAQDGRKTEAMAIWKSLLQRQDLDRYVRRVAEYSVAQAEAETSAPAAKGPSQGDIDAAAGMTAGDRGAMIEQMVASLDARLRDNPADPEGWIRLVRSYVVMGKPDLARDSLKRAIDALGSESESGKQVAQAAAAQGVSLTGEP